MDNNQNKFQEIVKKVNKIFTDFYRLSDLFYRMNFVDKFVLIKKLVISDVDINGRINFFSANSGLVYGEIYAYDTNATITITGTGIANKVQINTFNTNGEYNNTTPDNTTDDITILKAGIYKINVSISAESTGGSAYSLGISVFKNNGATELKNLHVHRNLSGGGGDAGSLNISGLASLDVNDTVEVWLWNETNTNNVIIDDINLNLIQIGGK